MKEERPPIPDPIAREVRQRCHFGCVICGLPIYQYDHMLEWARVKRHIASEITLLCDYHHSKKTKGHLTTEAVLEANRNPHNLKQSYTTPDPLYYYGNTAIIKISNSTFSMTDYGDGATMIPLLVSGIPLIKVNLSDQHFLLNIILFDENHRVVLIIKDNIMEHSTGMWDVEYIGKTLTIRQASRNIFIEVEFIAPNTVYFKRGKFYFNGNVFEIMKNNLTMNGIAQFSEMIISQCKVGISL